uniref:Nucleotidyltransferase family protein n=1 Tax=Thermus islandicus TaxID=540988 RepID=A0A7C2GHM8_9DEIN
MTPDMLDFLRALHGAGARFLVIGGYALAFLGRPRFTKDLDLWVDAREAERILAAIRAFFGGDDLGLLPEDLSTPGVVQLGYAPNRIDLVILDTPPFDAAFARALEREVAGVRVYVVHPEDFKALKRAFGRPVDLRDLEELE